MNTAALATIDTLARQIELTPGIDRLRALEGMGDVLQGDTIAAILAEADRFSTDRLTPFDRAADRAGCTLRDGRVVLAPGHAEVWGAYRDAGWGATDIPRSHGGQGLQVGNAVCIGDTIAFCSNVYTATSADTCHSIAKTEVRGP